MKTRFFYLLIALVFCTLNLSAQNLTPVQMNKKRGYVNPNGDMVIKPQFDAALHFENVGKVASCYGSEENLIHIPSTKGITVYDKGNNKYFIHVAEHGAIDNVNIYIVDDPQIVAKLKTLGDAESVVFLGSAVKSNFDSVSHVSGSRYYDLSAESIKAECP